MTSDLCCMRGYGSYRPLTAGDLWYDRTGEIIQPMFDQLSLRVKATPVNHVLGNHDYWVLGTPAVVGLSRNSVE